MFGLHTRSTLSLLSQSRLRDIFAPHRCTSVSSDFAVYVDTENVTIRLRSDIDGCLINGHTSTSDWTCSYCLFACNAARVELVIRNEAGVFAFKELIRRGMEVIRTRGERPLQWTCSMKGSQVENNFLFIGFFLERSAPITFVFY